MTPEELQEFENRFNQASNLTEKQEVAGEFVDAMFPNSKYRDILVKVCVELDELNNYFIKYNDIYTKTEGVVPTRSLIVAMNNLYANDIVDDNDLDGTGKDGRNSIIFKSSLAADNLTSSDIEFVVKSYVWLSQKENIKRMNFNLLSAFANNKDDVAYENLRVACADALQNPDSYDSQAVRDAIVYKDNRGNIRSKKEIEEILHLASSKLNSTANNDDKVSKVVSMVAKMSDDEKKELFQTLGINAE